MAKKTENAKTQITAHLSKWSTDATSFLTQSYKIKTMTQVPYVKFFGQHNGNGFGHRRFHALYDNDSRGRWVRALRHLQKKQKKKKKKEKKVKAHLKYSYHYNFSTRTRTQPARQLPFVSRSWGHDRTPTVVSSIS